jgi:hypothetical protein
LVPYLDAPGTFIAFILKASGIFAGLSGFSNSNYELDVLPIPKQYELMSAMFDEPGEANKG